MSDAANDGPLPDYFIAHIVRWLVSNEKHPSDVRHGRFPLGMVQRWIERAESAEAGRDRYREAIEVAMDALAVKGLPYQILHEALEPKP